MKRLKWVTLRQVVTQGLRLFVSFVYQVASMVTLLFYVKCLKGDVCVLV